mmetsp:Transcript_31721/g.72155  ORF Transcript_31721/g.72155 Transcript_31721/m.72155 type:complete len:217 (-) Transcript_31721:304-954(-)
MCEVRRQEGNPRGLTLAFLARCPDSLLQGATRLRGARDHGTPARASVVNTARQATARWERRLPVLAEHLDEDGSSRPSDGAAAASLCVVDALVGGTRLWWRWARWRRRAWTRRPGDGDGLGEDVCVRNPHFPRDRERIRRSRAVGPEQREGHVARRLGTGRPADARMPRELATLGIGEHAGVAGHRGSQVGREIGELAVVTNQRATGTTLYREEDA